MEANLNSRVAVVATLLIATTLCGCRSGGGRLARLNPWRSSGEDATAVARTAPELPSTQVAQAEAPAGSGEKAPVFNPSASTVAAAPAAQYPSTQYPSTDATTPDVASAGSASRDASASPYPTTAPPAAGPYNPNSYPAIASAASTESTAGSASKPTAASPSNRYAESSLPDIPSLGLNNTPLAVDGSASKPAAASNRYSAVAPPTVLPATTPSESLANTGLPTVDTKSSLGSVPAAYPSTPTSPLPTNPLSGNPLANTFPAVTPLGVTQAQATLPAGAYRPGGTSTYSPAVSVASLPKTVKPQTPPAPAAPAAPTGISVPAYPVTTPFPSSDGGYR